MIHKKILSLLVLLLTAATGAWADEVVIGEGTGTTYYFPIVNLYNFSCTEEIYTADEIGTAGTINAISFYYNYGAAYTCSNVKMFMKHVTRSVFESTTDCEPLSETDLVWTGSIAPTEAGWFTFTLDTPFEYNGTDNLLVAFFDGTSGCPGSSYTWRQTQSPNEAKMALRYSSDGYTPDPYNLSNYEGSKTRYTYRANIKLDIEESGLEVTTNAEEEGATFTEATFAMPAFDATANYDIVRDMEDEDYPVEFDGIAERVVVKQGGDNKYQPLTTLTIQLIDDISGSDVNIIEATDITVKVLKGTDNNGTITYDETDPIAYADFLDDMQPGLYKIVAEPTDATTSLYTGTASLAFEAIAGFPVDVPAKEYVTYYTEDYNLTVDNANAALYTITGVSGSTATATEITSANKEMPFLVYNSSNTKQTIILIATDTETNQTFYSGFVGTMAAATIAASTNAQSNYAFNGKQFVIVRTNLAVVANKAWLEVPNSNARNITIVFDDATGVQPTPNPSREGGEIYDLSGRKVKSPTRKGVYIENGHKKVIK